VSNGVILYVFGYIVYKYGQIIEKGKIMACKNAEHFQTYIDNDVNKTLLEIVKKEKEKGISKKDVVNEILRYGCERKLAGSDLITLERIAEDISKSTKQTSEKNEALERLISEISEELKNVAGVLNELMAFMTRLKVK